MRPVAALLLLVLSATLSFAGDEVPLTPVIGVDPDRLDFRCVDVGSCGQAMLALFNAGEPGSVLEITGLTLTGDWFTLVDPPSTPFSIPGDGSTVELRLEFCPLVNVVRIGTLWIESSNSPNSPLIVRMRGEGNLVPECDPGGPYGGEVGAPIQFDGTGSRDPDGAIVFYNWDFGDGGHAPGRTPTHTYTDRGVFTVLLSVTDDCSRTVECETVAEVPPQSTPVIGVSPPNLWFGPCNRVGECVERSLELSNDVPDPSIVLTVTELSLAGESFSLPSPPGLPLSIPGGGATVPLAIRFCPAESGSHEGTLTINAPGALNSPLAVPLAGDAGTPPQGANPFATLPLHAVVADSAPCNGYLPVDCNLVRPLVNVPANTNIVVFLFVYNHFVLGGLQTAFQWDPGWQLLASYWDCQPGQFTARVPGDPGGPANGTVMTTFNCTTNTALTVVGRLAMRTGAAGCLVQVPADYPCETYVIDCEQRINQIRSHEQRLGSICVHQGGWHACEIVTALAPTTWGKIKHSYHPATPSVIDR